MATDQRSMQSNPGIAHPERFDPKQSALTLMESEHCGRYCWSAPLVAGKSVLDAGCGTGYGLAILAEAGATEVTGIDIDPDAVAEARLAGEGHGARVLQGDLHALELPDDSFDAAVCFETIEHLDSPEQGLAELRRVIRPGGMLFVSSPNPEVYPSGNEHHVHELRADQLRRLVEEHFKNVQVHHQGAWLASVIEPAETGSNGSGNGHAMLDNMGVRRSAQPRPPGATFTIAIGCDGELPEPPSLISLGDTFEVRWWETQVSEARRQAEQSVAESVEPSENGVAEAVAAVQKETESRLHEAEERAITAERRAAQAEARNAALAERLRKTSSSLIDANQELAQTPLLKHRLAEIYEREVALQKQVDDLLGSRSWQATAFLRKITQVLKLQR